MATFTAILVAIFFSTRPKRSQLRALLNELLLTSSSFDTVTPHHLMKAMQHYLVMIYDKVTVR